MTAMTAIVPSATAYNRFPVTTEDTSTEPAIAVPREEPRLEALRESPEISPWSFSGKADCTTLTDDVSMAPTPTPMAKRPGKNVKTLDVARAKRSSRTMPAIVTTKPDQISVRWGKRLARRSASAEEPRIPMVAGVRTRPVFTAL